jgi:hypothetical protein
MRTERAPKTNPESGRASKTVGRSIGALSATLIVIASALRVSGAMSFCRSSRNLPAAGTISATANCIGCVLPRGRRRRSSYFEGSGQNSTRSVAAGASPLKGHPWASAARMRVQVQVRLAPLPETPLYKAILPYRAVGSSTGTRVPWMWVRVRPHDSEEPNHATDYDNRS